MFIKTTKAKGYEYIKLVESYRENGTTKHRLLYNFGRADLIKNDESFLRIVKRLCEIAEIPVNKSKNTETISPFDDCSEATLHNYGYLAYKKLWKDIGIDDCLYEIQHYGTKINYNLSETVFFMAVQHLLEPKSKLAAYQRQHRYFKMNEIELCHMYRALDQLQKHKDDIENELFEYNYVRLNKQVDVVFYDVTTIHFESVAADELKDFGFSKNCKFNEVQVVMGLIIDVDGIPIGYELFPGNTFDGKTMLGALNNIKNRFGINRVIIVADRGINCKKNLHLIKKAGYGYIVSSRIKSMDKAKTIKILNSEGFTVTKNKNDEELFCYKILEHTNIFKDENGVKHILPENLIITYSPKRADKDQKDRERLIEKAKKLLKNPEKIKASNKRGGKKYIQSNGPENTSWSLALDKVEIDSNFDGYYGIQTSEKNMTAAEIIEVYHTLWKIEDSFRVMKSTLEVRPVFHWTPKRIKGHFVVCFLAFLMERTMELLLKDGNEILSSPKRIQEALNTMQLASVTVNGDEMFIKASCLPLANKIFKRLGLEIPANISNKSDLYKRLQLELEPQTIQLSFF